MKCPSCGAPRARATETRETSMDGAAAVRRRRICDGCGQRFSTVEVAVAHTPSGKLPVDLVIVKRDALDKVRAACAAALLALPGADGDRLPNVEITMSIAPAVREFGTELVGPPRRIREP